MFSISRKFPRSSTQGAALVVAIMVLILLSIIGIGVYQGAFQGQKQAGLVKSGTEVRVAAEESMTRVITLIEKHFKNGGSTTPYVFPDNVNTTPWSYLSGGNYTYIPWNYQLGNKQAVIRDAMEKFTDLYNDILSYPPSGMTGWDNPDDPYLDRGVLWFEDKPTKDVISRVYFGAQAVNPATRDCLPGNPNPGNANIACITTTNYKGESYESVRMVINAYAEKRGSGKQKSVRLQRTLWLTPVSASLSQYGFLAAKAMECSMCHMYVYGGFAMIGDVALRPISVHSTPFHVMGDGFFRSLEALNDWPGATNIAYPSQFERKVDCSAGSDHAPFCQSVAGDGTPISPPFIDYRCKGPNTSDPNCLVQDGEPFNHSQRFEGNLYENISDASVPQISDIPELRDIDGLKAGTANVVNNYCPNFDGGLGCGDSSKYALNHYIPENPQYLDLVKADQAYSFIQASDDVEIYFDPGKVMGGPPDPTDVWAGDGTISRMDKIKSAGENVVIGTGASSLGASDKFKGYQRFSADGSNSGLYDYRGGGGDGSIYEGNMIIKGDASSQINICGSHMIMGDLMIVGDTDGGDPDSTLISTVNNCPAGVGNLMVMGNVYIDGNIVDPYAPDVQTAGGQPANGKYFEPAEIDANVSMLNIMTGAVAMLQAPVTLGAARSLLPWMNTEASHTVPNATNEDVEYGSERWAQGIVDPAAQVDIGGKDYLFYGAHEPDNYDVNGVYMGRGPREDTPWVQVQNTPVQNGGMFVHKFGVGGNAPEKITTSGVLPLGADYWGVSGPGSGHLSAISDGAGNNAQAYSGGWISHKELENLTGRDDATYPNMPEYFGSNQGVTPEDPSYMNRTHLLSSVNIIADKVLHRSKQQGMGEENPQWDVPQVGGGDPEPWTISIWDPPYTYDNDNDGLSIAIGGLFARDTMVFNPGHTIIYADPRDANPILNPLLRTVVAGAIKVCNQASGASGC